MAIPVITPGSLPTITLIIPAYNELKNIEKYFTNLEKIASDCKQIIIIDGNSSDGTYEALSAKINNSSFADIISLYRENPGRARQMNYGIIKNTADVIIFLHFDTSLPDNGLKLIEESVQKGALWGRFDVRIHDERKIFRVIEFFMNLRSSLTNIATGDQAIFARGDVLNMIGGYPEIPLMEDIALSASLKEISPAARIKTPVLTSARRWQTNGILKTIVLMWWIRFAYWLGIDPKRLARWYNKPG